MRPQKSDTWLWTTLWVTAFLNAALIYIAIFFILYFAGIYPTGLFALGISIVSYGSGAWLAARYIVKHSIVVKTKATKLASLGIIVPVIGSILIMVWSISSLLNSGGTIDVVGVGEYILGISIINAIVFAIIRFYIQSYGDDAAISQTQPIPAQQQVI